MSEIAVVNWDGEGYYSRHKHFVVSAEGGIKRDGWRWDKTHAGDIWGHKVQNEAEIYLLESRYLGECRPLMTLSGPGRLR
jgi:hypothetical protein